MEPVEIFSPERRLTLALAMLEGAFGIHIPEEQLARPEGFIYDQLVGLTIKVEGLPSMPCITVRPKRKMALGEVLEGKIYIGAHDIMAMLIHTSNAEGEVPSLHYAGNSISNTLNALLDAGRAKLNELRRDEEA